MLDNALISLIIQIIYSGLSLRNVSGVTILQAFQPTQQGIPNNQSLFLSKISDVPRGTPARTDIWDELNQKMIKTELQVYETTYQILSLYPQNPGVNSYTASDLANTVRQILQSDECISSLLENNVQILRVDNIRDPYFKDDRDQFEMSPSFDITLIHGQSFSNEENYINDGFEGIVSGIYPI